MQEKFSYQKKAILLVLLLILLALGSLLWIFFEGTDFANKFSSSEIITADIYQNGIRLESICLSTVTESYTITVTGNNGCVNTIEVRPGCIGITDASCPDKLCVHQGFINTSLLPITCLPNHLVIQIRKEKDAGEITPDIISY